MGVMGYFTPSVMMRLSSVRGMRTSRPSRTADIFPAYSHSRMALGEMERCVATSLIVSKSGSIV